MTNNNTDQERQWREDFEKEFKANPYYWNQSYLLLMSDDNPNEYDEQTTQSKWLWYLAARRQAEIEIKKLKNEMQCHINVGVGFGKIIDAKSDEIEKLKEQLKEKGAAYISAVKGRRAFREAFSQERKANKSDLHLVEDKFNKINSQLLDQIQELKLELQKERECVEFYADKENWTKCYECGDEDITEVYYVEIEKNDVESDLCQHSLVNKWGGKLARETIKNRKVL